MSRVCCQYCQCSEAALGVGALVLVVGGGGVGDDWTVPVASFPVVFLSVADQHLSVRMCDHLIPSTVTDRHLQDNKVGLSYYTSLSLQTSDFG